VPGDHRDVLLFGAGASIDAGLPNAYQLTGHVLERINSGTEAEVLRFVVGGLLYGQGAAGQDPFTTGVDIEALARAVLRLDRKNDSDVAPFVAQWQPRLLELERLGDGIFAATHDLIVRTLRSILWKTDAPVEYLRPLARIVQLQRRVVIGTLNYDNIVERFCDTSGIPYSTVIPKLSGINLRTHGHPYEEIAEGLCLIKLHGSLNWVLHTASSEPGGYSPERFVISWGDAEPKYEGGAMPAVLFGGENKLTAHGPFLDFLIRFRRELAEASRLIIVGYSFRDEHVNSLIATFVNRKPDAVVVVIDPKPPFSEPLFAALHRALTPNRLQVMKQPGAAALQALYPE
jgi:hypothetical protein